MEFGKVDAPERIDFSLPDDPPENAPLLAAAGPAPKTLYTGATGWSVRKWVGILYPKGTRPGDYLQHYSRQFNTIEFNTTFYRLPDAALVERWLAAAAEDFRFCPKVWQAISHGNNLGLGQGLPAQMAEALSHFREKLGTCFLQLPPAFGPTPANVALLERFFDSFSLPVAVEFRHPDWFLGGEHARRTFQLMTHYGVSTVITDVAGRRDVCHMRLTHPSVLIRFVGNSHPPTDGQRLDAWAERLQRWFEAGLHEAFFFIHQPEDIDVPATAVQWLQRWERAPAYIQRRGPHLYDSEPPGGQLSLF